MDYWDSKTDSPYHFCENRRPGTGCHGSCAAFKAWRSPLDAARVGREKDRIADEVLTNGRNKRYRENKRSKTDKNIGGFRQ